MRLMAGVLLLVSGFLSQSVYASPVGGPESRRLLCKSLTGRPGSAYALSVITQPINPLFNIRAIEIFSSDVAPGSMPQAFILSETNQDLEMATFTGHDMKVVLAKETFVADVYIQGRLELLCAEQE